MLEELLQPVDVVFFICSKDSCCHGKSMVVNAGLLAAANGPLTTCLIGDGEVFDFVESLLVVVDVDMASVK
jgi:hypothetical protein